MYEQRIGVDHAEDRGKPRAFVPVLEEVELEEGCPRKVEAEGVPVMVVRLGGRIQAIGDVCSHLGCSLADGQLQGASIICPCHGSRFDLETGEVLDGPATFPEPRFETRVRDGRIEVRAAQ